MRTKWNQKKKKFILIELACIQLMAKHSLMHFDMWRGVRNGNLRLWKKFLVTWSNFFKCLVGFFWEKIFSASALSEEFLLVRRHMLQYDQFNQIIVKSPVFSSVISSKDFHELMQLQTILQLWFSIAAEFITHLWYSDMVTRCQLRKQIVL